MQDKYYSTERSIQLLISLLKQYKIKKIIASPGTTNLSFVASLMQDSWFEMYSSVDERSAAYIACGMAAESGEPVVLTCTGATASRNYISGLTEAYYRKLPILAVTSTQDRCRVGHHIPQVIDRSIIQKDIALLSEFIPITDSPTSEWSNTIKLNRALLELRHRGGGPVHIDLATTYSRDYSIKELPVAKKINRITLENGFPPLPKGRIAIYIGNHQKFTVAEVEALEHFCTVHNAVAFCDQTSGYRGKFCVQFALVAKQRSLLPSVQITDLLIHIGEVSGESLSIVAKQVWRVSPDGELRDTFKKLTNVFEMSEQAFFEHYATMSTAANTSNSYIEECSTLLNEVREKAKTVELPFSNTWIAQQTAHRLPENSVIHLGILNTLRNWNMFFTPSTILGYSNTGGFGIDGVASSLIGASLVHPNRLYFGVLGDLSFFYDMNVLGNRHVGCNVRILLINNGKGTEFRNYNHPGADFGDEADKFIAAGGHYGNQSHTLVRHYAEDLGYEYLSATNKEEYLKVIDRFVTPQLTAKPMILEVFTNSEDESNALKAMTEIASSPIGIVKKIVSDNVGPQARTFIKKMLGR